MVRLMRPGNCVVPTVPTVAATPAAFCVTTALGVVGTDIVPPDCAVGFTVVALAPSVAPCWANG